jgi:hypothetical protein
MILSINDFTGKYQLSKGLYDNAKLQDYIDRYEPRYLKELFGVEFYNQIIADFDPLLNIPQSPNFTKLYYPFSEDVANYYYLANSFQIMNTILDSEGLKEMLKGFIYFEYAKDLINQMTPFGNTNPKSENSEIANTIRNTMYNRYNEAVRSYQAIQEFILLNPNIETGQIVQLSIINSGTNYPSMIAPLLYATEQITDGGIGSLTIQIAGTNYPNSGNNIALSGGSGSGATIDYIATGGIIQSISINQKGINYSIGDLLYIQDGDLNCELYLDDLFYTTQFISEVTGSGSVAEITTNGVGVIDGQYLSNSGSGYADGEFSTFGGFGSGALFAITVDPLDPNQSVFTLDLVEGGENYQAGDLLYLVGGNQDAEITINSVTDGVIQSITINEFGKDYKIGDIMTISGGDNNAQFEVIKIGIGYNKFKGVRKLFNYWI